MVPKTAYPPIFHPPKSTRRLTPLEVQTQLADFLSLTSTHPYLHPDAQLSTSGISFAASSGPVGGLALHHVRRIEAGLRGERLGVESTEELEREFGVEAHLPDGNDEKLDRLIDGTDGSLKRKRTSDWAETSSNPDLLGHVDSQEALAAPGAEGEDWQDKEEYEHEQRNLVGDVGERGGKVVKQNGAPPAVQHVGGGDSKADKKARKEAKKERLRMEKAERSADRRAKG